MNNKEQVKTTLKLALPYLIIAILLIVVDQVSKIIAKTYLADTGIIYVIDNFAGFYLTFNEGAAWSSMSGQRVLLSSISLICCIALAVYFIKAKHRKLERIAICLLFAGAFGNLIDRALLGKVTDFLYCNIFILWGGEFPIFNIADLLVTAGAILLVINWLFFDKEEKKELESE